ncbi:MAG: low molecular weight protein-tyrosine-phosphatase [Bacteroidota bacterium]|nr:low molecular weight protein-tyrosine-phosphatase [Bacteroidota bacterium]
MVKILFVCLGNICRSPLAEAQFNDLTAKKRLSQYFEVGSAGTASFHVGDPPDFRTVKVGLENNILITHLGRQLSRDDFKNNDYILVMDSANYLDVIEAKPENSKCDILYLRSFDPHANGSMEVPDPFYGTINDFEMVFSLIGRSVKGLLDYLIDKHQIPKHR